MYGLVVGFRISKGERGLLKKTRTPKSGGTHVV